MCMIAKIKVMKAIREYVEEIIFSIGGSKKDVKRVMKKIKQSGCITIEEADSFLENVYI